jgi:excisionase family DNA binding protein
VKTERDKKAYTIPEAAKVTSVGESTLKDAIDRGDLPKRYPSSRPIILESDLDKWLESLPTERP